MDEELASTLWVSTLSVNSESSDSISCDEVSTASRGDVAGALVGLGEREAW
ncbi:MAG: hypothetical protein JWR22_1468 [Herminiimonas sp.]|nr:hypothetical protein [Herminiimonas sp.]